MSASEITALVAVGVTGLSIFTNYLLSGKRSAHDTAMLQKRLDHERAEAVRDTAAWAYAKVDTIMSMTKPARLADQVDNLDTAIGVWDDTLTEIIEALGYVKAVGWNREVRDAAAVLHTAIWDAVAGAGRHVLDVKNKAPQRVSIEELERQFTEAKVAHEAYRIAMAREGD